MASSSTVAIVILNWNGKHFLEKFLPSVMATLYNNVSLVVADNASTDDSVLFLEQHFPSVRVIKNVMNEGFAKGYNSALRQVDADFYVLLNSDVEVTPGWIQPVIELMEKDERIAACQPKVRSYHNPTLFEYAGAAGGWIDTLGYPFSRGRVFEYCETDSGQYDEPLEVFWATGTALFVRSAVFHELDGFDEFFFAHQEEIDLCWRMQLKGYKIYAQPASVIFHVGGGTLPMGNKRKVFLNFRNNLVMLAKNLSFAERIWKIPLRIFLDNVAALQALLKGDMNTFKSIEKAHYHFLKYVFHFKRKKTEQFIDLKKMKGVYHGSIVWEYFIRKRNTFTEIVGDKK